MKKVLLKGYFTKNLGDDLFFYILSKRYPKVIFSTYSSMRYKKNSLGANLKIKYNFMYKFINKIIRILTKEKKDLFSFLKRKYDMMVLIGGSIYYENVSLNKLNHYIHRDFFNNFIQFCIISSNLSCNKNKAYYYEIEKILNKSNDICFRDLYSFNKFSDLSNVRYAPDAVFSLDNKEFLGGNKKQVVISVINPLFKGKTNKEYQKYKQLIKKNIKKYINNNYSIVLMSFCKYEGDEKIIKDIYGSYNKVYRKNILTYLYRGNIKEALTIFSQSEVIIASRFHANVLGFLLKKQVIPIVYADKTYNLLKDLNFYGKYYDIRTNLNNPERKMDGNPNFLDNINSVRTKSIEQFGYLDSILK